MLGLVSVLVFGCHPCARVGQRVSIWMSSLCSGRSRAGVCRAHLFRSMSVTQAMEWLIEHVDDPSVDTPLPSLEAPGAAAASAPSPISSSVASSHLLLRSHSQPSAEDSGRQDELTEIFKRIRRKREFRPDSRVGGPPGDQELRGS